MNPTWDNLATSPRWHRTISFIRHWVGSIGCENGMAPEELHAFLTDAGLRVPQALREWYLLAAQWSQGGLNVWIHPRDLAADNGCLWVHTDTHGVTLSGIRTADLGSMDPPVFSEDDTNTEVCSRFSDFVAGMVINDVIFGDEGFEPMELAETPTPLSPPTEITTVHGTFCADAPLDSASIVWFVYPDGSGVFARARNDESAERLASFRK